MTMCDQSAHDEPQPRTVPRWKKTPPRRFRTAALPSLALNLGALVALPLYLQDYRWSLAALVLAGTAFGLVARRIHSSSDATGIEVLTLLGSTAVLGLYAGIATVSYLP